MHNAHPTRHNPPAHGTGERVKCSKNQGDTGDRPRRIPYALLPAVQADRVERESLGITPADYGTRWRASFAHIVGDVPLLRPGDRDGARLYLAGIERALDRGGWTPSEWGRLRRMRDKWTRRAEGRDARFEVRGNMRGGIDSKERKLIQALKIILGASCRS